MKNTVSQADIDKIIQESQIQVKTVFGKCIIVAIQLKNGFILVESSLCADPINYSEAAGVAICIDRIKNKLWELEEYKLQSELLGGK